MSDGRWLTAEEFAQKRGEERVRPHLSALEDTMSEITRALHVNSSELVVVLSESDWADVPTDERAVMLLGCQVVHADVPAPMVAVRARRTLSVGNASTRTVS